MAILRMVLVLNSPTIIFGILLWLQYRIASCVSKSKSMTTQTTTKTTTRTKRFPDGQLNKHKRRVCVQTKTTNDFLRIFFHTCWSMRMKFQCAVGIAFQYIAFLVFTLICIPLKAALQMVWLPIIGLLWWFNFFRNLLDDPDGQTIMTIFKNPSTGFPQNHINEERKRHTEVHRFHRKSNSEPSIWRGKRKKRFIPPPFTLPLSRKRHPRAYMKCFPGTKRTASIPACFLPIDH